MCPNSWVGLFEHVTCLKHIVYTFSTSLCHLYLISPPPTQTPNLCLLCYFFLRKHLHPYMSKTVGLAFEVGCIFSLVSPNDVQVLWHA